MQTNKDGRSQGKRVRRGKVENAPGLVDAVCESESLISIPYV